MKIHIESLEIFCIIGVLDFERESQQRVLLDLEIEYHYEKEGFLDYSKVASELAAHLKREKYLLLEEALLGIKKVLFADFPMIDTLHVKLSKPDILPQCSVGLSGEWVHPKIQDISNTPQ